MAYSWITARLRRRSPLVDRAELVELMLKDREHILAQLRMDEMIRRRPRRGARPAARTTVRGWSEFVEWLDRAIAELDTPGCSPDVDHVVRDWQNHRSEMVVTAWGWRRRADVIAADPKPKP